MTKQNVSYEISREQFDRICDGIIEDRETIIKHNPIGTPEEILLWMLLGCLISYLSIPEDQMPCFSNKPDTATYRDAIKFVLKGRIADEIDVDKKLDKLI